MKRTIIVSDFSGKVIENENDIVVITFIPRDRRKQTTICEAHADDDIVTQAAKVGRTLQRRGRKPTLVL